LEEGYSNKPVGDYTWKRERERERERKVHKRDVHKGENVRLVLVSWI